MTTNQIHSIAPIIPQGVNPATGVAQNSPLLSLLPELIARIGLELPPAPRTRLLMTCKGCLQFTTQFETNLKGQLEQCKKELRQEMRQFFALAKEKKIPVEDIEKEIFQEIEGLTPQNYEQNTRNIDILLFTFFNGLEADQLEKLISLGSKNQKWVGILVIARNYKKIQRDCFGIAEIWRGERLELLCKPLAVSQPHLVVEMLRRETEEIHGKIFLNIRAALVEKKCFSEVHEINKIAATKRLMYSSKRILKRIWGQS